MIADRSAVERFLNARSEAAFDELYARHAPAMYALARRLLGATGGEDDVLQDAWIRAIRKLPDFRWDSALRTWLCGVVVNCCRERFRGPLFDPVPEDLPAPEIGTDLTLLIERALARLAPGYRAIVILHDLEGFTHAEIGALLAIDPGTSKSQLFRARRQLRRMLGDDSRSANSGQRPATEEHAS
jgi:RNA polymerase sigma-70 factor (ECF subfamily)